MATTASVQECEEYVEQHGIQAILKECIAKICQERPPNHYQWLREYFERLEKARNMGDRRCFAYGSLESCVCVRARRCSGRGSHYLELRGIRVGWVVWEERRYVRYGLEWAGCQERARAVQLGR